MSGIGASVRRLEDRPLLTGQGRFAADISFADQLHMVVVRSPIACGRLIAHEFVVSLEKRSMPRQLVSHAILFAIDAIDFAAKYR